MLCRSSGIADQCVGGLVLLTEMEGFFRRSFNTNCAGFSFLQLCCLIVKMSWDWPLARFR